MNKIKFITILLMLGFFFAGNLFAEKNTTSLMEQPTSENQTINIYFFGSSDCPYCRQERKYLTEYAKANTDVKVYYFELDSVRENAKLLVEFEKIFDEKSLAVPVTFISDKVWIGFSENIGLQMENIIDFCKEQKCKDTFEYLENKEEYIKYITDNKYFKNLGTEEASQEKIGFFKRIINFFKSIFKK